jgi:cytochrome P450
MILFPVVATKAQDEIDRVVGSDRLPSFQDRESLPYVDALAKEVLRWHSVVPTGMWY